MLTSRLTSTDWRAMRRAPVERLTVTIAGKSCGVSPTAIASEKSSASSIGRPRLELTMKMNTVSTPVTLASSPAKRVRPRWNAVGGWWSLRLSATPPIRVCAPVATTTPTPRPPSTTVPA